MDKAVNDDNGGYVERAVEHISGSTGQTGIIGSSSGFAGGSSMDTRSSSCASKAVTVCPRFVA
jgi:hypothetical protein